MGSGSADGLRAGPTVDRDASLQVDALEAAGCDRVFVEQMTGMAQPRAQFDWLLDRLRPGATVVVWRLDRLGRPLRHLVDQIQALADRQVGFRSLQETIDTSSPGGRLVFFVFASWAEFERDLIQERTNAGLAAARARGRLGGRPPHLSPDQVRAARQLRQARADGRRDRQGAGRLLHHDLPGSQGPGPR